jgi:DNA repair protein SbcD/Mre11
MALRVFLTSDLHLGMKFLEYPAAARERLVEERFACLERMVVRAEAARCDLLVVAGDLFHRTSVARRDIERAADALREFQGRCVAVLPGNHDYLSAEDQLWPQFRARSGDGVLLLDEPRPFALAERGIDACLYPGPCLSIHSPESAVGWVRGVARDRSIRNHIGVAHGSLEGVSPDFGERYYPMTQASLLECGLDVWLLGHTHVPYPERVGTGDRIFYAGTPAPDGFDCRHEGRAWVLTLDETSPAVTAEQVSTGDLRFREVQSVVQGAADLDAVQRTWSGDEASRTILRLRLSGRVTREVLAGMGEWTARLSAGLLHLDLRDDQLCEEITRETIDREFPEGSFPHALLGRLADAGDQESLSLAHEILKEVQG